MPIYAKYKQVNRSGTRNVFLTGHTLVFTITRVVNAYLRSILGALNGEIIKVYQ